MSRTKRRRTPNPYVWFLAVMVFLIYLSGCFAINDGKIVVGVCAVVAALALQFAVLRLASRE